MLFYTFALLRMILDWFYML